MSQHLPQRMGRGVLELVSRPLPQRTSFDLAKQAAVTLVPLLVDCMSVSERLEQLLQRYGPLTSKHVGLMVL
jgi:hypothetical protein